MGSALTLEIVEGPGRGRQLMVEGPVLIGRDPGADLALEDSEVSRHHAKVTPAGDASAVIEDLDSTNGTFVNGAPVHGSTQLEPGDELLLGVTLILVRSREQVAAQPTAVRAIPPGLAVAQDSPDYVSPDVISGEFGGGGHASELDRYLDVRVRRQAQLAPLAVFVLVALALIVYFATR